MPKSSDLSLNRQAIVFGRYLVNQVPNELSQNLYQTFVMQHKESLTLREQKLFRIAERHPWTVGMLDAGLVFVRPDSVFRKRLYVMFSILETMPEYRNAFLPARVGYWYLPVLAGHVVWNVLKAAIGIVFLKVRGL